MRTFAALHCYVALRSCDCPGRDASRSGQVTTAVPTLGTLSLRNDTFVLLMLHLAPAAGRTARLPSAPFDEAMTGHRRQTFVQGPFAAACSAGSHIGGIQMTVSERSI